MPAEARRPLEAPLQQARRAVRSAPAARAGRPGTLLTRRRNGPAPLEGSLQCGRTGAPRPPGSDVEDSAARPAILEPGRKGQRLFVSRAAAAERDAQARRSTARSTARAVRAGGASAEGGAGAPAGPSALPPPPPLFLLLLPPAADCLAPARPARRQWRDSSRASGSLRCSCAGSGCCSSGGRRSGGFGRTEGRRGASQAMGAAGALRLALAAGLLTALAAGVAAAGPGKKGSGASDASELAKVLPVAGARFGWRNLSCPACKVIFTAIDAGMQLESSTKRIQQLAVSVCVYFHFATLEVCQEIIGLFEHDVLTTWTRSVMRPAEICGLLLGSHCGHWDIFSNWTVTLPETPKPPVRPPTPPPPGAPVARVLFLTDLHWDRDYAPGSSPACKEPLCCRGGQPQGPGAGFWGTYSKCDLPLHTLENLLQHLAATGPYDMAYWTGDIPAHNIWQQSRGDQLYALTTVTSLIQKYLGPLPVYPAVGNHESVPVNFFPPPDVSGNQSSAWLYSAMVDAWRPWLPHQALETLRLGGFYTLLVQPGLRLVSLNMNFCSEANFWLLINSTDPAGQLQWLVNVLQEAEKSGEKVHIIGHIPPSHCKRCWGWNYYHIINRFEGTVAGQFFGHTHVDEFEMFYDEETLSRPVGIAFVAPSVTTYINLNPGYRIYHVDGVYPKSSYMVLDHETFILNLTLANLPGAEPQWQRLYGARETYGFPTAFPADWDQLLQRFQADEHLFQRFWYLMYKGHPPIEPCREACKVALLCALRTGRADDPKLCRSEVHKLPFPEIQAWWRQRQLC
ncbi:sphingomyelin phosphodiesterase [Rhineura floridana]|uniref:sphingomyelin phosphodiesterase n=1 Tax=Rhineura floridana TaxID=261503 RepID=UPI002AC7F974|nr:sphingomyelin phosphodiesterase [Rhineura floridana]